MEDIVAYTSWFKKYFYCKKDYSPELMEVIAAPDDFINSACHYYKNDATATVVKTITNNGALLIKRSNIRSFKYGIKRGVTKSKAMRYWHNAWFLKKHNINSITPVAVVEERFGPIRRRSYFIARFLDGVTAADFFSPDSSYKESWHIVAPKIMVAIVNMQKLNCSHGDLKLENIIISNNEPFFIDLDPMKIHSYKVFAKIGGRRDLNRFMHNWQEYYGGAGVKVAALFNKLLHQDSIK